MTVNRNVLLMLVVVVVAAVVGVAVGVSRSQSGSAAATPTALVSALPTLAGAVDSLAPTNVPDTAPRIEIAEYKPVYDQGNPDTVLVDVRVPDSYAASHITGALSVPEAEMATRLAELPKDKHIVLYCA